MGTPLWIVCACRRIASALYGSCILAHPCSKLPAKEQHAAHNSHPGHVCPRTNSSRRAGLCYCLLTHSTSPHIPGDGGKLCECFARSLNGTGKIFSKQWYSTIKY